MRYRFLLVLGLAIVLAGCADRDGATHEWRFAIEEIQGSVQDAYAQKFKELIEARTAGRISVTVYPYGTVGSSAQITEMVQSGALQFAFASPGHLGSVVPEAQIFSLHFLFPEDDHLLHTLLTGDPTLYRELDAAYRARELALLSIVAEGWMAWTGNRPLRALEDFRGFRMRTMVSPLLLEAYNAYGADPTPLPYSEVYSGLQLNMIDGQVNPVFAIEEMSFYEVQKAITFPRHLPFIATVVTNPAFFDGLSPELRQIVTEVKGELDDYIFDVQRRYNAERLAVIRANSDIEVVELSEAERARFREASLPVRQSYLEAAGPRGERLLEVFLQAE